jgi:hypothetical protein
MILSPTTGATMTNDDTPADEVVERLSLPDDLGSPRLMVELAEAAHAALRAAQQGWVARMEDGPGEADSPVTYEDPSGSRVSAQVAVTAVIEHLQAVEYARPAKLPPELVAKVLSGLRYKPGWTFEPAVMPDGTVAVRAIADLEDHLHPGRTFRTSRSAPLELTKAGQPPGEVVTDAALRAVLSIEEHEIREQLLLDGRRSQPLDPHTLPAPTNTTPKARA